MFTDQELNASQGDAVAKKANITPVCINSTDVWKCQKLIVPATLH